MPQQRLQATKGTPDRSKPVQRPKTPQNRLQRDGEGTTEWQIKQLKRENKNLHKHLLSLVNVIKWFDNRLSAEMALPSSHERGRRIARLTNALSYAREGAEYHGLGVDSRKAKDLTEGQRLSLDKQFQQIHEFNVKFREDLKHREWMEQNGD